jgi:hypothetical protein
MIINVRRIQTPRVNRNPYVLSILLILDHNWTNPVDFIDKKNHHKEKTL